MATMISEVYDALIDAGAGQEKARKAAEAVAAYDGRMGKVEQDQTSGFARLEQRFSQMEQRFERRFSQMEQRFSQVDQRFTKLEAELTVMKWMGGLILAGTVTLLLQSVFT